MAFTRAPTSAPPLDELLKVVRAARTLLDEMENWHRESDLKFERRDLRNALAALDARNP